MTHIRVFDRIKHRPLAELTPLTIEGNLPDGVAGDAYEARIPFAGEIGNVSVDSWSGNLPAGATVTIDNVTDELVVGWPAYQAKDVDVPVPIINGDFSVASGWSLGHGWSISGGVAFYLTASDSRIVSETLSPVDPGDVISISCDVYQGASSENSCGGAVRLAWFDENHGWIGDNEGNVIKSSEGGTLSSLTAAAPSNAAFVAPAANAFRRKQNKEMHIDNMVWDHSYTVGGNTEDTFCVTVTIRDEAGRTAVFSDCMNVVFSPILWTEFDLYKGTPEELVALPDLPWQLEQASPGAAALTNGVSANRIGVAFRHVGDASNDHYFARLNTDTMVYEMKSKDGPTLTAGAGKFMRMSRDATWAIVMYYDGGIYLWKWDGTSYLYQGNPIDVTTAINATAFVWSPDGTMFAIGDSAGVIKTYSFDNTTGAIGLLSSINTGMNAVSNVDWAGNYVVAGGEPHVLGSGIRVYEATPTLVLKASRSGASFAYGSWVALSANLGHVYGYSGTDLAVLALNIGAGTLTLGNVYAIGAAPDMVSANRSKTHLYLTGIGFANKLYAINGDSLSVMTPPPGSGHDAHLWL